MGKKLRNPPLVYTVAQVQFNSVPEFGNYRDLIAPKMRQCGFPVQDVQPYAQLIMPSVAADGGQSATAAPTPSPRTRYIFGEISNRAGFVLEQDSLAFQTTDYDSFDKKFLPTFMQGLEIIHDALQLVYVQRIGLRYINVVKTKSEHETLTNYLNEQAFGLSDKAPGTLQYSANETLSQLGDRQYLSRIWVRDGQVALPFDILGAAPKLPTQITSYTGKHALLDNDAFEMKRAPFVLNSIRDTLIALHESVEDAFESAIKDDVLNAWRET